MTELIYIHYYLKSWKGRLGGPQAVCLPGPMSSGTSQSLSPSSPTPSLPYNTQGLRVGAGWGRRGLGWVQRQGLAGRTTLPPDLRSHTSLLSLSVYLPSRGDSSDTRPPQRELLERAMGGLRQARWTRRTQNHPSRSGSSGDMTNSLYLRAGSRDSA
jgi:hypothetical protein